VVHRGVPKFVDASTHEGLGMPPSKLPSATTSTGHVVDDDPYAARRSMRGVVALPTPVEYVIGTPVVWSRVRIWATLSEGKASLITAQAPAT
jgi:hypothetical protein